MLFFKKNYFISDTLLALRLLSIHILKKYLSIYLFILAAPGLNCGMRDLLVATCGLLSGSMWTQLWHADFLVAARMRDLVHRPGIEPGPPALGGRSLTHWTTREVPPLTFYSGKWHNSFIAKSCNLISLYHMT